MDRPEPSTIARASWDWFGASVRGPGHIQDDLPNQDAWSGRSGRFGSAVVVCDGLGSRPNSAVGSKAACRVVFDALRHWTRKPGASTDSLIRLVHDFWTLEVHPLTTTSCATTCLFAAAPATGPLLVAQLGDGLAAIRPPGGPLRLVGRPREGFANETTGLGIARSIADWSIVVEPEPRPGTIVLLTTDGISDDLLPERLDEFVEHLADTFPPMPRRARSTALAWRLRRWETPLHSDDKTLALFWYGPGA